MNYSDIAKSNISKNIQSIYLNQFEIEKGNKPTMKEGEKPITLVHNKTKESITGVWRTMNGNRIFVSSNGKLEISPEHIKEKYSEGGSGSKGSDKKESGGVVDVKKFKYGEGGTKGVFIDDKGKLYKSLEPQQASINKEGKAERKSVEGVLTEEHKILSELQDKKYIPKVGDIKETSEGTAFEIEKLNELESLSLKEFEELKSIVKEINDEGYHINDKISVMRRPETDDLVIVDFSNGYKASEDRFNDSDIENLHSIKSSLSKQDQATLNAHETSKRAKEQIDLFDIKKENPKYLLTQRPPSIGTHPVDNQVGEPKEKDLNGRKVYEIEYSKSLSKEDIERFELTPVPDHTEEGDIYERKFGKDGKIYAVVDGIGENSINVKEIYGDTSENKKMSFRQFNAYLKNERMNKVEEGAESLLKSDALKILGII